MTDHNLQNSQSLKFSSYMCHRLKSVLQLMAASEAGRDVVYFTFGDEELQQDLASLYTMLTQNSVTIAQV